MIQEELIREVRVSFGKNKSQVRKCNEGLSSGLREEVKLRLWKGQEDGERV